jgi:DNA polymerase V
MQSIIIPAGEMPASFLKVAFDEPPFSRPYLASVQAGFPSPAEEYLDNTLNLHEYLVRNKTATFYFRAAGWSMRDAGVNDQDLLVVDRSITPKHGHVVVAAVNNEYTVKKLHRRAGVVELRPANPEFEPIRFSDGEELVIWGVVTSIVRVL